MQERLRGDQQIRPVLLQSLGLHGEGFAAAATLPVLMTALLFVGPLCMLAWDMWHGISMRVHMRRVSEVG